MVGTSANTSSMQTGRSNSASTSMITTASISVAFLPFLPAAGAAGRPLARSARPFLWQRPPSGPRRGPVAGAIYSTPMANSVTPMMALEIRLAIFTATEWPAILALPFSSCVC